MHIFFDSSFPENTVLSEEESKHAARVMRLKVGDQVAVINGKGSLFECQITAIDKKSCALQILEEFKDEDKGFKVHIALAPTKNIDRTEWFVEKCVEFGIDEISFLQTKNSERKVLKMERIERIAIAAMKQSKKKILPVLNPLTLFKEFVTNCNDENKAIAHLVDNQRKSLKDLPLNSAYCILIGPEGDFTAEEVALALENDFTPTSLGNYRLRTETAGIAACHALNFMHE